MVFPRKKANKVWSRVFGFSVGDQVRSITPKRAYLQKGKIISVRKDLMFPYEVKFESEIQYPYEFKCVFKEEELELVEEK